jgi:hypothetical protein
MRPLSDVISDLDVQQHRRFIKSHTPLDGLPFDTRVTYICIARDPRDAALSFDNHMMNLDIDAALAALEKTNSAETFFERTDMSIPIRPLSQHERFWGWMDSSGSPGLRAFIHHLSTFWQARESSNVVLLHYDDLKRDVEGQMRLLADRLNIAVSKETWPGLARAATFEEMRMRANDLVPNATAALWYDNTRFFNRGTSGQWRGLLTDEDVRRYEARIRQLAEPDLSAWLHRGLIS